MATPAQRVKAALDDVKAAERSARNVIHDVYPIGTELQWERGRGLHSGCVVHLHTFGAGDSLRVRNYHTSKIYWIDVRQVRMILSRER